MVISAHGFNASLALLLTIPVAFILFSSMKPARAAAFMAIAGAFYLPEGAFIRIPSMPLFAKNNLPYIGILLAAAVLVPNRFFKNKPFFGPELISFFLIISTQYTVATNQDPLTFGSWIVMTLPGLNAKDGFAMGLNYSFHWGLSLMAGRLLFETREDLHDLVRVIISITLVYSLWCLVEIRMSPRMHIWLYGYFPSADFTQSLRWGGFRPNVFMIHGLNLSMAMLTGLLITAGAFRAKFEQLPRKIPIKRAFYYLFFIQIIIKGSGAIAYAAALAPLVLRASVKVIVRVAQVLAIIVLVYPFLRANDYIPVDDLIEFIMSISEERALSLKFRFENEGLLLKKAQERLWWGWGSYGRNGLYHPVLGDKEITIADGTWIIMLSITGLVGMFCSLAPAAICVVVAGQRILKLRHEADQFMLCGILVAVAVNLFDMIPNSMSNPFRIFLAGAVLTLSGALLKAPSPDGVPVAPTKKRKKSKKKRAGLGPPPPSGPWPDPNVPVPPLHDQDVLFGQGSPGTRPAPVTSHDQRFGAPARDYRAPPIDPPTEIDSSVGDNLFEPRPADDDEAATDPSVPVHRGDKNE